MERAVVVDDKVGAEVAAADGRLPRRVQGTVEGVDRRLRGVGGWCERREKESKVKVGDRGWRWRGVRFVGD